MLPSHKSLQHCWLWLSIFTAHAIAAEATLNLTSVKDFMTYSEGVYDDRTQRSYAAQCHKNEKAAEMMAVSKLSKFLTSSRIESSETASASSYKISMTAETKSFRPEYTIAASHDFDGYHCYLVSTKD